MDDITAYRNLPIVEAAPSLQHQGGLYQSLSPEQAAERLRQMDPNCEAAEHGGIFSAPFLLVFVAFLALLYVVRHPLLRLAAAALVGGGQPAR